MLKGETKSSPAPRLSSSPTPIGDLPDKLPLPWEEGWGEGQTTTPFFEPTCQTHIVSPHYDAGRYPLWGAGV